MVARFVSGKNIEGMVGYNEQKVASGKAELIDAVGFPKDRDQLQFSDKMGRFKKLITMNGRVVTNAVHISLNFDPSERIADEKLREIATCYMERIGFGKQPFLVYRHDDAGHPHIHIVSTNIQASGERIPLHNIGRLRSEPARKQIEQDFGLIAAGNKMGAIALQRRTDLSRIIYGQQPTKKAIADVVDEVVRTFRFTSLPGYNAILQQYGVLADRGSENTAMHAHKGLQYWIIDKGGNKCGVPVKASSLPGKPTLGKLEKLFVRNEPGRHLFKASLHKKIDTAVSNAVRQNKPLASILGKQQVCLVPRRNKDGVLYGVTFVDRANRTVFNGSDLGKEYSAHGLLKRLGAAEPDNKCDHTCQTELEEVGAKSALVEQLLAPVAQQEGMSSGFKKKRKKRNTKRI